VIERDRLREAIDRLRAPAPATAARLDKIAAEWDSETGHLWFDRVRCLFVETDGGEATRGRMYTLVGAVEPIGARTRRPGDLAADEVTFEGQLRAPDDPFVGVVYDSLKSVRPLLRGLAGSEPFGSLSRAAGPVGIFPRVAKAALPNLGGDDAASLHAHFRLEGNSRTATGDSIGLAAALVAYTQLLRPEIMRHERFVSSEVAFTGSIAANGTLLPINAATLAVKLERAVFSTVRYVVIPAANEAEARAALAALGARYPRRRLGLIAAERLSDVVENYNIVRSERMCIGQFVARKAVHWGRSIKTEVALLAILLYVLLAITWTRTFAPWWFDHNPVRYEILGKELTLLNAAGERLWATTCQCESILPEFAFVRIVDVDSDADNEVAVLVSQASDCPDNAILRVFDQDGDSLWSRSAIIPGQPAETLLASWNYEVAALSFRDTQNGPVFMTVLNASLNGTRSYIRFFDSVGDPLGWYVHSGYTGIHSWFADSAGRQKLVMQGWNNAYDTKCLFLLDPFSAQGCSPPFNLMSADLMFGGEGNQPAYVLFPLEEISRALGIQHYGAMEPQVVHGRIKVTLLPIPSQPEAQLIYYFDQSLRVEELDVSEQLALSYKGLVSSGALPSKTLSEGIRERYASIRYWTNGGWVTEGELRAAGK